MYTSIVILGFYIHSLHVHFWKKLSLWNVTVFYFSESLEEEVRRLREARLCKICMDKEVGVVLLPCGHLVTCVLCASSLPRCPVCRENIKATVRTFLSWDLRWVVARRHEILPGHNMYILGSFHVLVLLVAKLSSSYSVGFTMLSVLAYLSLRVEGMWRSWAEVTSVLYSDTQVFLKKNKASSSLYTLPSWDKINMYTD